MLRDVLDEEEELPSTQTNEGAPNPAAVQREFFSILGEFFSKLTGRKRAADFATSETFFDVMKSSGVKLGKNHASAFDYLADSLEKFYAASWPARPATARGQGGVKLVLGGGQRFPGTAAKSVQSMLLYADTILIPDPVLPWLEAVGLRRNFHPSGS